LVVFPSAANPVILLVTTMRAITRKDLSSSRFLRDVRYWKNSEVVKILSSDPEDGDEVLVNTVASTIRMILQIDLHFKNGP
jgi:hypothetical protein